MSYASVVDVLAGKVAVDETVTVRGWVRTRRDSKAGISFINVHDGYALMPSRLLCLLNYPPASPKEAQINDWMFSRCNRCGV